MMTQQDRGNRETDYRTSRHLRDRATGGSPSRRNRSIIWGEAPLACQRAPAVQLGPSDAYSEGPLLLLAVGLRSTDTDGFAPGPSVKMTPRSGGTSE